MTKLLTIRRRKSDNQAIGYTWCYENQTKEEIQKLIDDWNAKYPTEYYEFSENEDLINLLPPHRHKFDCEDICNKLDDVLSYLQNIESDIDDVQSICESAKEACEKLGDYSDD